MTEHTDEFAAIRDRTRRAQCIGAELMAIEPATIASLLAAADRAKELEADARRLQDMLFARGAMAKAPCFCCGYNGTGYFQPDSHPCAKRHHAAIDRAQGAA